MCVNTGISGSSSQVLTFSEGNMLSLRVFIALCETEINNVYIIFCGICVSYQEIIGLDISMNYALFMHFLNSLNHLGGNAENCF